jgi:hypothetical protein
MTLPRPVYELLAFVECRGKVQDHEIPEHLRDALQFSCGKKLAVRIPVAGCAGPVDRRRRLWKLSSDGSSELALHRMTDVDRVASNLNHTQPTPPAESAPPRLSVDVSRRTITFDGASNEVPSVSALRWVKVLAEHRGEWISGSELEEYDPELDGVRTDRLRKRLPESIRTVIDSDRGKGSRIRF